MTPKEEKESPSGSFGCYGLGRRVPSPPPQCGGHICQLKQSWRSVRKSDPTDCPSCFHLKLELSTSQMPPRLMKGIDGDEPHG